MKKTFWLVLVILTACLLALTACGDSNNDTPQTPDGEHVHALGQWTTTIIPTCTENGTQRRECSCGYAETKSLNAIGHRVKTKPAVAPTCTTPGFTEGTYCRACNVVLTGQTEIDALGHLEATTPAVPATCTESGKTEGKHCSRCDETLVEQTIIEALGHIEAISSAVPATCTEGGKTEGKHCSRCNDVLVEQVTTAPLGHIEEVLPAVPATCTESGKTEGKHCSRCDETLVEQIIIEALGHNEIHGGYVAPTCTKWGTDGGTGCAVCGITITGQNFLEPIGHNYAGNVCVNCNKAEPNFAEVNQYRSYEGYRYFESVQNGNAMRAFYDKMEEVLYAFHHSTGNATFFETNNSVDLYLVYDFNYVNYNLTKEEAQIVWMLFRKDHPLYYWMSSIVYYDNKEITVVTEKEYALGSDRARYNEYIYQQIEVYTSFVDGETSPYNIALTYYQAITSNCSYAYDSYGNPETASWAHNILGGLVRQEFVCEGYAKLFQLLLNYSGVENIYIAGDANGNHVWNIAKMDDGNWYWFDLTWGDTGSSSDTYKYFCATDSALIGTHTYAVGELWQFNAPVPPRPTQAYKNDDSLEIGEVFTLNGNTYCFITIDSVACLEGDVPIGTRIVYDNVVYEVI